jgi:hypothetical protein
VISSLLIFIDTEHIHQSGDENIPICQYIQFFCSNTSTVSAFKLYVRVFFCHKNQTETFFQWRERLSLSL